MATPKQNVNKCLKSLVFFIYLKTVEIDDIFIYSTM